MDRQDMEASLPTDDDVALYRERGYYVSRKVLSDDVIDEAFRGAERHFAGERDFRLPVEDGFGDWKPGDPETIRNSEFVALQNVQIRALVMQPIIGAIAARLAGSDEIRLWDDQLVWKPPSPAADGPVVGWHTDRAYWMTCTSEEMLTAWIPFHDCPDEMGPVIYVEGSHRWPETDGMRSFNAQDFDDLEKRFSGKAAGSRKRLIALKKGEMSFHHSRLIHGSDVNRGTTPRLSLALHMQDGPNRWRPYLNEQGDQWEVTNDRLARKDPDGTPDYTDPSVFPIMWPQPRGPREGQVAQSSRDVG
jgi:Phytanoyl-CoA dioxygenase (PhyH)